MGRAAAPRHRQLGRPWPQTRLQVGPEQASTSPATCGKGIHGGKCHGVRVGPWAGCALPLRRRPDARVPPGHCVARADFAAMQTAFTLAAAGPRREGLARARPASVETSALFTAKIRRGRCLYLPCSWGWRRISGFFKSTGRLL